VALLAEAGVEDIRTFSIGFEDVPEEKGSEFEYSDLVVDQYQTKHQKYLIPNETVLPRLTEAVDAMAEPMFGQDAIGFYDKAKIVYVDNDVHKPKLKGHISVKAPVFPFKKLSGSVMSLTPEMKSTGEVMGISSNFGESFAKSQASASNSLPTTNGGVFLSLSDDDKGFCVQIANDLIALGFSLCATKGTYNIIKQAGIECEHVLKVSEGRPNVADKFINNDICLAFNTSNGEGSSSQDGEEIRKVVLNTSTPYVTNVNGIIACIEALKTIRNNNGFEVKSLQDFLNS